jgi:hypothetical protein
VRTDTPGAGTGTTSADKSRGCATPPGPRLGFPPPSRRAAARRLTQRVAHFSVQLGERHADRTRPRHEAYAHAGGRQQGLLATVCLPQPAPRPIASHAAPEPPAGGERRGSPARCSNPQEHEARVLGSRAAPEQTIQLPTVAQPLRAPERRPRSRPCRHRSDGQPSAALGPPPLEHLPTALGRHALPEAMGLLPTAPIRLVRALHAVLLGSDVSLVAGAGKSNHPTDACFIKSSGAPPQIVRRPAGEGLTRPRGRVLWLAARFPGRMDPTRRVLSGVVDLVVLRPLGAARPHRCRRGT